MPTIYDLGKLVKEKYPGIYDDLSDDEVGRKTKIKYPESYKDFIDVKIPPEEPISELLPTEEGIIQRRGEEIKKAFEAGKRGLLGEKEGITPIETGLRTVGAVAGGVGEIAGRAVMGIGKAVLPKVAEEKIGKAVSAIAKTQPIQLAIQEYQEWKAKNPRAAASLESLANIAALLPIGKGAQIVGKPVIKTGLAGVETGLEFAAKKGAQKMEKIALEATGKVIQGTKEDILRSAKVLSEIDTVGVKSYEDLSKAVKRNVSEGLKKVDDIYKQADSTTNPTLLKDLVQEEVSGIGKAVIKVKINYIKESLSQLEELYTTIKAPSDLARIRVLKNKAIKEGLLPSEINQIAREYGTEFGTKAFSKIGEPLTSVNAQAFENTRKGIKTKARSFLPDEASKILDKKISSTLNVERLVKKMEENVNKLSQRVQKRGIIEKITRRLAGVIDIATFGGLKAFTTKLFFPSNVGLKTLNSLDLEKQLVKNLKLIQQINKLSDKTFAGKILQLFKKTERTLEQVPKRVNRSLPQ